MPSAQTYQVIVIGAGHAGIEASLASARMGCPTLLLTASINTIGKMSCNPAIGGPAKSHLVFEMDALGGYMGWAADQTALQLKMLNTSKGPAVWSLRAQSDMYAYQRLAQQTVCGQANLDVRESMVLRFLYENEAGSSKRVYGVCTQDGTEYRAQAVVLTTGTFMRGLLHTGLVHTPGGRVGEQASNDISSALRDLGVELGRLKTGTPPRLHRDSINFSAMKLEPGDVQPYQFSTRTEKLDCPNIPCHLTYTSDKTHQIIRDHLHESPMYTGKIEGTGPRYCPSIEDKVVKFADKDRHQIFIEPTGRDHVEMYPSGFSTSLPAEAQLKAMRTLPGLEQVEFVRPGYAVEYDFVFPHQLKNTFELQRVEGLYCAGQICGTSGYEEAAAQGLYAGINAALKVQSKPAMVLTRDSAYIGCMIDDLITKEITEPYRMFTGRSEFRLLLRQDNADIRLTSYGRRVGLVADSQWNKFEQKKMHMQAYVQKLKALRLNPDSPTLERLHVLGISIKKTHALDEILKRPEITLDRLIALGFIDDGLDRLTRLNVETDIKYAGFVARQQEQVRDFQQLERIPLPANFSYLNLTGLRKEAMQKLEKLRPANLGQASRIAGVNPADLTVLMVQLKRR